MATKKKRTPAPAKTKAAPRSKVTKTESAVSAPAAAAKPKGGRRMLVPVLLGLLLLVGFGQIYWKARYLASLKFDLVHVGRIIPQGHDQGQAFEPNAMAGDKKDQVFILEGEANNTRVQRFDPANSEQTLVYKPLRPDQAVVGPQDLDVDANGDVYVLQKDGTVKILSNDLKFKRSFKTGVAGPSAITVDSTGLIYVAATDESKVVLFDSTGSRSGDFGVPGSAAATLIAPVRIRETAQDELVVLERIESGLRVSILKPDHTVRKRFLVDKIQNCEPVKMGLNSQGKVFFNDHMGSRGMVFFDLATGKLFGESQATKDGQKFINPGCSGGNRFTPSIYVHTVPGMIKCLLPSKDDTAEEGQ